MDAAARSAPSLRFPDALAPATFLPAVRFPAIWLVAESAAVVVVDAAGTTADLVLRPDVRVFGGGGGGTGSSFDAVSSRVAPASAFSSELVVLDGVAVPPSAGGVPLSGLGLADFIAVAFVVAVAFAFVVAVDGGGSTGSLGIFTTSPLDA